jgi:hypothetical protein
LNPFSPLLREYHGGCRLPHALKSYDSTPHEERAGRVTRVGAARDKKDDRGRPPPHLVIIRQGHATLR